MTQVAVGSPAEKAALKAGDVITAANKKAINSLGQLAEASRGLKAGDRITLSVRRDKQTKEIVVTVQNRPRGGRSPTRPWAAFLSGQRENAQGRQGPDGFQSGGVYKSTDGGESWTRVNSLNPRPMYFSQVRVDPSNDNNVYVLGVALYRSSDGGKSFKPDGGNGVHADQHALWIDPRDGRHALVGTDGGFYVTYDRMQHWDFLNTAAIGQFYHVCVDTRQPYHVYGGLQDNASWGGPSRSLRMASPTTTGSWSTAVMASSARSSATIPTSSMPKVRTATCFAATCAPAQVVAAALGTVRSTAVSLQLEHAFPPVAPQSAHPLLRWQLRVSLRRARPEVARHLAGHYPDKARQRQRRGRVESRRRGALRRQR